MTAFLKDTASAATPARRNDEVNDAKLTKKLPKDLGRQKATKKEEKKEEKEEEKEEKDRIRRKGLRTLGKLNVPRMCL